MKSGRYRFLWTALAIVAFATSTLFADTALPGEPGGGPETDPDPPPSLPESPSLGGSTAGNESTDLRTDLGDIGLDPDTDSDLNDALNELSDLGSSVDSAVDGNKPGRFGDARQRLRQMRTQLEQVRQRAIDSAGGDADKIAAAEASINELRAQLVQAENVLRAVDNAINNADNLDGVRITLGNVQRFSGFSRGAPPATGGGGGPTADGMFSDFILDLEYSYAFINDENIDGNGDEHEGLVFFSGVFADKIDFGLGVSTVSYDIDGPTQMDRTTQAIDFYAAYNFTDWFSLGAFVNFSQIDIEDSILVDPILGAINIGDSYSTWSSGLNATFNKDLGERFNVGLTTSLVSANKKSLARVFDTDDTAVAVLGDVNAYWTDQWASSAFVGFYALLDREEDEDIDGTFWFLGGDVSYAVNDRLTVIVGYETTLGFVDYDEHRVNLGFSYAF